LRKRRKSTGRQWNRLGTIYDERLAAAEAAHAAVRNGPDVAAASEANARLHAIRDVGTGPDLEAVRHQLNKDIKAAGAAFNATMAQLGKELADG
jgi:hypothetical protein